MSTSEYNPSEQEESRIRTGPSHGLEVDSANASAFSDGSGHPEGPSSSSPRQSQSQNRTRKRKRADAKRDTRLQRKQSKQSYSDKYRQLLNATIKELGSVEKDDLLRPVHVGATIWTTEEQEVFFNILARKGRHDLRGIAASMTTKSESEIHVYLKLLQKETAKRDLYADRRSRYLDHSALDAATEIGKSCDDALSLAGEALSDLQQHEEELLEEKKHGKYWLLTPLSAKQIDQSIDDDQKAEAEMSKSVPAATLLRLGNFLRLSKRFFMNSSDMEGNWCSYTESRDGPNMMYTAFSDFQTLAISVTKRLMRSSLFFAMSKVRAVEFGSGYVPKHHVRRRDVQAALDMLGMKSECRNFWAELARRHKLRVYDHVRHRTVSGKRYSYEDIERILSHEELAQEVSMDYRESPAPYENHSASPSKEDPDESDAAKEENSTNDPESIAASEEDFPKLPDQSNKNQARELRNREQQQDEYMETLDQQATQEEERRLWKALGVDPDEKMDVQDIKLPDNPQPPFKSKEDLVDWKDSLDYAAEWETNLSPVPASKFVENRKIGTPGKGLYYSTGLSSSDEDEEGAESEAEDMSSPAMTESESSEDGHDGAGTDGLAEEVETSEDESAASSQDEASLDKGKPQNSDSQPARAYVATDGTSEEAGSDG